MDNKTKIVVSTFNNSKNNYGALFQSCGLHSFLTELGYDVSYVTIGKRKRKKAKKTNIVFFAKEIIKKILLLPHFRKMQRRKRCFEKFAQETQTQIKYATDVELFLNPPVADIYISGSDQVWNPVAMHEDLFLAYAPKGSRKISYAASMGCEKIPDANKNHFYEMVSEYSAISVREDTIIDIISPNVEVCVHHNIDPVFLKSHAEWQVLEKKYDKLKYEEFIFVYAIEWNLDYNDRLTKLKEEMGLPVVSVNIGNIKNVRADQVIYDASPNEFLYLLNRARCVVATSFHAIAMSIIYNKPFLALAGLDKPTRIQSIARHFDIDVENGLRYGEAEFAKINKIIEADCVVAHKYLKSAIEL